MNSFKIGDKIIYPNQGLGIIEDIQIENYFGEEFKIYHVRIICNETLVLVPSSNADEIGIRPPIREDTIDKIKPDSVELGVQVILNLLLRLDETIK